jgi:hypothetical protein
MRRNSPPYSRSSQGRRQPASGGDEDFEQVEIGGSLDETTSKMSKMAGLLPVVDETMSKASKIAELLPVVPLFVNSRTRTADWTFN